MSSLRVWEAFFLSVVIAIPTSVGIVGSLTFAAILSPFIDFLRYLPVPALIPLTILIFGVGEWAKVFLLLIGTVFQLVVLLTDELRNVPLEFRELIASLGIRGVRRQVWMFRQVLPAFYDDCRVAVGWCWTYVIIAELVAAERGLGHAIKEAQRFSNTASVYAGIIAMGIIGLSTDAVFRRLYRPLFPYLAQAEREGR